MADRRRSIEVEFLVNDRQANQKLSGIESNMGKTAKSFGQAASFLKVGFAAVAGSAILDVAQKMDEINMKAEAVDRRFDQVFGNLAETAREWADEQKEAFGEGQTDMEGLMASVQDLLIPMGFARDEAFLLTKEILTTANATSEWEGGNISASDATMRFIKAMTGEREGLKELGIVIQEADIDARLLAKGQEELTGEARKQAKAQATLELAMEGSADALAAYEDRAGTAIATQKEMLSATEDTAESWSQILKPALDAAKDTIGDTAVVAKFLTDRFAELIPESDGVGSSIMKMIGPVGIFRFIMDELAQKIDEYEEAQKGATSTTSTMIPVLNRARDRYDEMSTAAEGTASAVDDATASLQEHANEMRAQTDPIFNVIDKLNDLETAQRNTATARDEYGEGSPEHREALRKEAEAFLNLQDAQVKAALESGITKEKFRENLEAMSIFTRAEIDIMMAEFDRLDGRTIDTTIRINRRGDVTNRDRGEDTRRASGGEIRGAAIVGERGPELFVPDSAGTIVPNGGFGGRTYNITVHALDSNAAAKAVVQALQKYDRDNGGVPIRVRPR